jgi:hypothetical protein
MPPLLALLPISILVLVGWGVELLVLCIGTKKPTRGVQVVAADALNGRWRPQRVDEQQVQPRLNPLVPSARNDGGSWARQRRQEGARAER